MMTTAYEHAVETLTAKPTSSNGTNGNGAHVAPTPATPEPLETKHLQLANQAIADYEQQIDIYEQRSEAALIARDRAMMHAAYANAEAATRQAEVAESMLEFVGDFVGRTDLVDALLQWSYRQKAG